MTADREIEETETAIGQIRVFVEGADGLAGRPYMPDHAIDILLEIAWERQRQVDIWGHTRDADDRRGTAVLADRLRDYAIWVALPDRHPDVARRALIEMAALAMAAAESIDRRTGNARPDEILAETGEAARG